MAFGKKKKQKTAQQPAGARVDRTNNPFYPPKKESAMKEVGTTLGVVLISVLLVGIIVKNFNIYTAGSQGYQEADGDNIWSGHDVSDTDDIYVGDYAEDDTVEDDTAESEGEEPEIVIEENAAVEKSAALLPGDPEESMMAYTYVPVASAYATSTISQTDVENNAIVVFDGLDETSWQEGVDGYGVGESLSCSFHGPYEVKYMGFKLGNWKNDKYYFGNAKPKTVTITLGDFSTQITFTGERRVEWVKFDGSIVADSMQVTINDIYPGTNWDDTCIAEIAIYGN